MFGVGTSAKCCELKRCADRVRWRRSALGSDRSSDYVSSVSSLRCLVLDFSIVTLRSTFFGLQNVSALVEHKKGISVKVGRTVEKEKDSVAGKCGKGRGQELGYGVCCSVKTFEN